ncbi:hypothetical protein [Streptomyces sp. NPDC006463]|uniref:hypothetical protein n=1 Tax=Streptomyces sp. NPDC006463 TaxID=3364746 RepID=UPI0036AC4CBF
MSGVLQRDGEPAAGDPKELRYRLLHVAARITRGGRRLHLRTAATRPWRQELAAAFDCLAALARPAGRLAVPARPRFKDLAEPDRTSGPRHAHR